jgi:hypothetical protein
MRDSAAHGKAALDPRSGQPARRDWLAGSDIPDAFEYSMQEPLIIHCQCPHDCHTWIRVEDRDTDLLGDLALVHPGHACPTDSLWDVRPGYLILQRARNRTQGVADTQ